MDGAKGIYYIQFGLNLYGYTPDPGNCAVDLTSQNWDSLPTTGSETQFTVRHNSDLSMLSVNFLDSSGNTLGVADTCDPLALAQETASYDLLGNRFRTWFYLYTDETCSTSSQLKTISGGMYGKDIANTWTSAYTASGVGSLCVY